MLTFDVTVRTLKAVMAFEYGLLLVAFVPLFVAFLLLLKRNFESMYHAVKVRISIFFVVSMLVLGFRFVCYNFIQFSHGKWQFVETLRGEIPLYLSEILIAFCYTYIIFRLARQQQRKQEKAETNELEDPLVATMGGYTEQNWQALQSGAFGAICSCGDPDFAEVYNHFAGSMT